MWVAGSSDGSQGNTVKKVADGKKLSGINVDTRNQPYFLNPKQKHATQAWTGTRWCLSCYTARSEPQMDDTMRDELVRLGFPLREVPATRTFGDSSNVCTTSSKIQEPLKTQDGVQSICLSTPHALDGRPVAQPESDSVKHLDPQGGGLRRSDGQQVHHAEEEGRVHPRHPHSDQRSHGGAQEARRGTLEVDLEHGQAQETAVSSSGGMEEARCASSEGDLREGSVPRPRASQRQALDAMEPSSACHGDRNVARRSDGGSAARGRVLGDPDVSEMQHTSLGEDESSHQGGLFRMRPISPVHPNTSLHLRGTTHQRSTRSAERAEGGPRDCDQEGHEGRDSEGRAQENSGGVAAAARDIGRATSRFVRWIVGADGASSNRREHGRREGQGLVQHQPDPRGDEADPRHEEGQGGRGEVTSTSEACATAGQASLRGRAQDFDSETCKTCKPESLPRSPKRVRECILEGAERRRVAKKGTVKRLLGNAKAVAASVLIASCAAVGMAMQTIPQGSIVRPDLLEVVGGEAQVTRKFDRWGWNAARPVSLGSDDAGYDVDGQRRLLEWIDRCQPRLVVLTCPRAVWLSCGSTLDMSSQEKRRARKKCLKYEGFLGFVEQVFDKQIRRGDDALAESPVGNSSFRETAVRKLIDHPEVYTVVVDSSNGVEGCFQSLPGFQRSSLWMSTSVEVCEEIALRCHAPGGGPDKGSSKVAAAICKGYVRTLRRKDPSRIRRML